MDDRLRSTPMRRWRARGRIAEAAVYLGVFSVAQRAVPMKLWSWVLGHPESLPQELGTERIRALRSLKCEKVSWQTHRGVTRAAERLPWNPSCLAQAAAGQSMLRSRGRAGVVVIGLRKVEDQQPWSAHAWLLAADGAITGGREAHGFTPTTVFVPKKISTDFHQLPVWGSREV